MARIHNNPLLRGAHGRLGTFVVYKQYRYGTVASKYPDMSNVEPTEAQKKQRERFRAANHYAKVMMMRPEKVAEYTRMTKQNQTIQHVAMEEYFRLHPAKLKKSNSPVAKAPAPVRQPSKALKKTVTVQIHSVLKTTGNEYRSRERIVHSLGQENSYNKTEHGFIRCVASTEINEHLVRRTGAETQTKPTYEQVMKKV